MLFCVDIIQNWNYNSLFYNSDIPITAIQTTLGPYTRFELFTDIQKYLVEMGLEKIMFD